MVQLEFMLMMNSLQELVVAQSMTWPAGFGQSSSWFIGSWHLCSYLNFANWSIRPGNLQRKDLS